MKEKAQSIDFHPRNKHQTRYDFERLALIVPELRNFFMLRPNGTETLDFSQAEALRLLNRALLIDWYGLQIWDIPKDYLCPPVPGRADYIHHLADILSEAQGIAPEAVKAKVLDIGVGANCIYPIVGACEYGWQFVGADIDPKAVQVAQLLVKMNTVLAGKIDIRLQKNDHQIFGGIVKESERFDVSMCNPPFYKSQAEADAKNRMKSKNLSLGNGKDVKRNFGGQNAELYCEGGEFGFISRMIRESVAYKSQITWFTSLVANRNNLEGLERQLKKHQVAEMKIIPMTRGLKASRVLAWRW